MSQVKQKEPVTLVVKPHLFSRTGQAAPLPDIKTWTQGLCPNCGYTKADVDPEGILWCPACGYSKKGCYT